MRFDSLHRNQIYLQVFYSAGCDAGSIGIHAYNEAHFQDKCLMFQKCTNDHRGCGMDESGVNPFAITRSFGSFEQVAAGTM